MGQTTKPCGMVGRHQRSEWRWSVRSFGSPHAWWQRLPRRETLRRRPNCTTPPHRRGGPNDRRPHRPCARPSSPSTPKRIGSVAWLRPIHVLRPLVDAFRLQTPLLAVQHLSRHAPCVLALACAARLLAAIPFRDTPSPPSLISRADYFLVGPVFFPLSSDFAVFGRSHRPFLFIFFAFT